MLHLQRKSLIIKLFFLNLQETLKFNIMGRRTWTDEEMILALDLYFKLPFGKLCSTNKDVKKLASLIGRTDSSVAIRLTNYAACDPYIINSGRKGMVMGKDRCMPYWNEFANDRERLFLLAEKYRAKYKSMSVEEHLSITPSDLVGKEREAVIKQRVNQSAFRMMILSNYDERCAITGINIPQLLVASHIIPWSENERERLNPENGICLSALYDKCFDQGVIGIRPDDFTVVLSRELKEYRREDYYPEAFGQIENRKIMMPMNHRPDVQFLNYHLERIFAAHN
jgi:putative restriction endonuclease